MSGRKNSSSKHKHAEALMEELRRKRGTRTLPRRHLIVCEDGKSSRAYFEALKSHFKLDASSVEVARGSHRSAPEQVVARAKERKEQAASPDSGTESFDKVWCVIDGDYGPKKIRPARTDARREKIELVVSTPCFEYWLLLHFEDSAGTANDCSQAEAALKKHIPQYHKGKFKFDEIVSKALTAGSRAEKRRAGASSLPENQNPCSEIYRLVNELKEKA